MNPLDEWAAAETAATMKWCPELSREERESKRIADSVAQLLTVSTAVENEPETVDRKAS